MDCGIIKTIICVPSQKPHEHYVEEAEGNVIMVVLRLYDYRPCFCYEIYCSWLHVLVRLGIVALRQLFMDCGIKTVICVPS